MAVKSIRRGPSAGGAPPNFTSRPVANDIYIDGSTDKLVFSTGTSGTSSKTLQDTSSPAQVSVATGITAFATGGQTNATQLTAGENRVDTVATAGDSVKLPLAVAGQTVVVINNATNAMQVFGAGTDTINGVATATGVSQPGNSADYYYCAVSAPAGAWYVEAGVGFSGSLFTESVQNNITAFAGGGQTNATQLTAQTNRVTTVATRGDSVKLPVSAAGLEIAVINLGAQGLQIFGSGTDTINGVATATGIFMPPNSVDIFFCPIAGIWFAEAGVGFSGSLFTESAQDTITAFATGGQTNATQLTAQTNRVTTVATVGDSVKLPVSAPGLELMLINSGANAMQVFGAGTDTIDGVATATGVSQMANSLVIYTCTTAGAWFTEGLATGFGGTGLQTLSFLPTVTAFATGGQTNATQLTSMMNRVAIVATAGDSVKLPASSTGLVITVINSGANDMQVFGAGTDTIDGVATATGVSQPNGVTAVYSCNVAGAWVSNLAAQGSYSLNRITDGETLVADANATVTAAQLLKGFLRSIPTAARTWTLDTAANIDAAIPNVKNGHNFTVYINNNSAGAFSINFTAGVGMTFFPTAGVTIAQNKTATLTLFRTGAGAWTVYHQVGA